MPPVLASAAGGKIVIVTGTKELAVGSYTLSRRNKHGDTTGSHTAGWETALIITKGGEIQAKIFWDTTTGMDPYTLGLDGAWVANLWVGDTGKMHPGVSLLTSDLDEVGCSQDGVVEFDVTAKINATLPALATAA
jgi:hypothetical protein